MTHQLQMYIVKDTQQQLQIQQYGYHSQCDADTFLVQIHWYVFIYNACATLPTQDTSNTAQGLDPSALKFQYQMSAYV